MKKLLIIFLSLIKISQAYAIEQASSLPNPEKAVGHFIIIDPKFPPTNGIWMSWSDAHDFAENLNRERMQWERNVYYQQRAYELEKLRRQFSEKQLIAPYSDKDMFWRKWGFPLGLTLGVLLVTITSVAVYESAKR